MVGVGIKSATASATYIAGKHTAAATNDTVLEKVLKDCSDKRDKGLVYPREIRRREVSLRRICGVVSGILDRLAE
ncbi:hypothetical protein F2Q69_00004838 [Brassica cretica]|uniref:Uncharacterized protein n=1 Tax=Brassica cretica TaxID=69181 RepID=A0A8S9PME2_BRACR|nr:hypothetical protein F2Q69_00004838 [Brassica cretica]